MEDCISVIVPVYNVENYLSKCIDSIKEQSYSNIEIILVDDGSKDKSGEICDKYASLDDRITVYHNENRGVAYSRNFGRKIAKGNYIAFIDSDDTIDKDYLKTLYNKLKEYDADVAISSYVFVKEDGSIIPNNSIDSKDVVIEKDDILKETLLQKNICNFVCKLYKKDVLVDYKENVIYEDIVFTLKVMQKCNRVVFVNQALYFYLKRDGSESRTFNEKNLLNFCEAIGERYDLVSHEAEDYQAYNIYTMLNSLIALCTTYAVKKLNYESINQYIDRFTKIVITYMQAHKNQLDSLLDERLKKSLELLRDKEKLFDYLEKSYYESKNKKEE